MDEILRKVKKGDKDAFSQLINIISNNLYCIAISRTRNEYIANEALQETFIALYQNIGKIREENKLKAWTIKVLINNCNRLMKKCKIVEVEYNDDNAQHTNLDIFEYNKIDSEIDFMALIGFLEEDERTILAMLYSQGYTIREISNILKINENTVKSKIKRSKEKISSRLGGKYNDR